MNGPSRMIMTIPAGLFALTLCWTAATVAEEEKKPDFPPFEEVVKDMKVKEGFFTLYHDEKKDKLLAKIPQGMLEKNFLAATTITEGPFFAGFQWNDAAVYWERMGKKLVLVAADPRYTKAAGTPVGDVIGRTYTDRILQAVKIVTEAGGDPVIDLGPLLKSDFAGVGPLFGGAVDGGLSRYGSIKNFKSNTEITVRVAVMSSGRGRGHGGGGGGGGGQIVGVHFSFSELPAGDGFEKREADDRVGYFLTAVKDWTTDHAADSVFKRRIHRWRLRKTQPDQAVSDVLPEDQIVYYIEKTVPVKYRRYVREGILEWNKAFEAAGLRNVMVVHQQTDKMHADKDPADIRFNFFRWIVTGAGFAMGPSRVDPFTGRILDADIIMDDAMVRYTLIDHGIFGPRGGEESFTDGPVEEFRRHHPDWEPSSGTLFGAGDDRVDPLKAYKAARKLTWGTPHHDSVCEMGRGMARQLAMAGLVAAEAGKIALSEEFVGQAIKETVMHEVGHTLGLRHNFKASSWLDLETIKKISSDDPQPTTASVMDYNPYTFAPEAEHQGWFATPTLGPYDMWAIDYGYRHFKADPEDEDGPKDEAGMLKAIASRCAEPGLAYNTDEDTSHYYPDPAVNRWDYGSDAVAFARERVELSERLWADGLDWAVEDGKSPYRARRVMGMLLSRYGQGVRFAARLVGGQSIHRHHKGDPNERAPIEPISAAKQREALSFLGDTVLSGKSFDFPPEVLNSLGPARWRHWDSDAMSPSLSYDIHSRVLAVQSGVLSQLLNPFTLNRLYDTELYLAADEDTLSVAELFDSVHKMVWTELNGGADRGPTRTNRKPMVRSYRRALQRNHLQRLIGMVLSRPGSRTYADVHAVARLSLKRLGEDIDQTLTRAGGRMDEFTKAHLLDSKRRVAKALEAEYTAR